MIIKPELNDVKELILMAIEEDIKSGDVTSESVFSDEDYSRAVIKSKEKGIFCGNDIISHVYTMIDPDVKIKLFKEDGDKVNPGDDVVSLEGPTISILAGERICLNFVQRMSGIATKTNYFVSILQGSGIEILDTRKTLPGFRLIDKYSVLKGGGTNHRMGLYDMVMLKDNHIKAAGSIEKAVDIVRAKHGDKFKIEVETTNIDEVKEAMISRADIIMLDNMSYSEMEIAINEIDGRAKIEVSGNVDEKRLQEFKTLKIDYISIGALTHSVSAFDLSMKFL